MGEAKRKKQALAQGMKWESKPEYILTKRIAEKLRAKEIKGQIDFWQYSNFFGRYQDENNKFWCMVCAVWDVETKTACSIIRLGDGQRFIVFDAEYVEVLPENDNTQQWRELERHTKMFLPGLIEVYKKSFNSDNPHNNGDVSGLPSNYSKLKR